MTYIKQILTVCLTAFAGVSMAGEYTMEQVKKDGVAVYTSHGQSYTCRNGVRYYRYEIF